MKTVSLLLILLVLGSPAFGIVGIDDVGSSNITSAELEALRAHSVIDDIDSQPKFIRHNSFREYIESGSDIVPGGERLGENYTDRFLAPLVVIINRAPEGTARDAQKARVYVDGVHRRTFNVSTGRAGYESRIGYFRPVYTNHLRVYDNYYSNKYKTLMAKAIFYSGGYAIHHTDAVDRLGTRASSGCVRFRLEDITYINDLAIELGNQSYERRNWSHSSLPRHKQNNHFRGLERSDIHPINRWTGAIDTSRTINSLDMVILVKDQRERIPNYSRGDL